MTTTYPGKKYRARRKPVIVEARKALEDTEVKGPGDVLIPVSTGNWIVTTDGGEVLVFADDRGFFAQFDILGDEVIREQADIWKLFEKLWTQACTQPGHDKDEWKTLKRAILNQMATVGDERTQQRRWQGMALTLQDTSEELQKKLHAAEEKLQEAEEKVEAGLTIDETAHRHKKKGIEQGRREMYEAVEAAAQEYDKPGDIVERALEIIGGEK